MKKISDAKIDDMVDSDVSRMKKEKDNSVFSSPFVIVLLINVVLFVVALIVKSNLLFLIWGLKQWNWFNKKIKESSAMSGIEWICILAKRTMAAGLITGHYLILFLTSVPCPLAAIVLGSIHKCVIPDIALTKATFIYL